MANLIVAASIIFFAWPVNQDDRMVCQVTHPEAHCFIKKEDDTATYEVSYRCYHHIYVFDTKGTLRPHLWEFKDFYIAPRLNVCKKEEKKNPWDWY